MLGSFLYRPMLLHQFRKFPEEKKKRGDLYEGLGPVLRTLVINFTGLRVYAVL